MSKILTFRDGQTFTATDSSTVLNLKAIITSFAGVDPEWEKFTTENMTLINFDGETFHDIIPVSVSAQKTGANILMTVSCREISQAELLTRQAQQIEELQEALAELG